MVGSTSRLRFLYSQLAVFIYREDKTNYKTRRSQLKVYRFKTCPPVSRPLLIGPDPRGWLKLPHDRHPGKRLLFIVLPWFLSIVTLSSQTILCFCVQVYSLFFSRSLQFYTNSLQQCYANRYTWYKIKVPRP